jgi:hypothetical protein
MIDQKASKAREGRKKFISRRHEIIRKKYLELKAFNHHGIKLDIDQIIYKIAEEMGFSERTIREIIKKE